MTQEDYVSYETAQLLKEKGFNWPCRGNYYWDFDDKDNSIVAFGEWVAQAYNNDFEDEVFICSAPTLQMAMKWLREKNIFINIYHYNFRKAPFVWLIFAYNKLEPQAEQTYEQAAESAIKYILENWDDINEVLEKYYKNDEILPKI